MSKSKEVMTLGGRAKNIGEEIVRLKKNIDMQLGLEVGDKVAKSFLEKYNKTNERFDELIMGCK